VGLRILSRWVWVERTGAVEDVVTEVCLPLLIHEPTSSIGRL